MNGLVGTALGAFLGIVAGTVVTICVHRFQEWRANRQQVRNLCFELRLNLKKIDRWLAEITRYRNAVNGDSLHTWFGYFDFGKTINSTANAMSVSGLIYKTLSYQHIEALQAIYWELSPAGEQYMNEQFTTSRNVFNQLRQDRNILIWSTVAKPEAVGIADFWERKLTDHRSTLQKITRTITD